MEESGAIDELEDPMYDVTIARLAKEYAANVLKLKALTAETDLGANSRRLMDLASSLRNNEAKQRYLQEALIAEGVRAKIEHNERVTEQSLEIACKDIANQIKRTEQSLKSEAARTSKKGPHNRDKLHRLEKELADLKQSHSYKQNELARLRRDTVS